MEPEWGYEWVHLIHLWTLKGIHEKTAPCERRAITEAPAFEFTNWRPRKQKKPRATRKKGKPRKNPPKKNPPESSSS